MTINLAHLAGFSASNESFLLRTSCKPFSVDIYVSPCQYKNRVEKLEFSSFERSAA